MLRTIAVAATAILMTGSPLALAQTTPTTGTTNPSAADLNALTDLRVALIRAALQLTPDQEKLWPTVEEAMRARAKNRMARWEKIADLRDNGPMDVARNPVQLLQRRAEALSQRGADLKKVADAWEPLYKTLSDDQKKRMLFVTVVTTRGLRETIERNFDEDEDE